MIAIVAIIVLYFLFTYDDSKSSVGNDVFDFRGGCLGVIAVILIIVVILCILVLS